jgi:hypothetical protein
MLILTCALQTHKAVALEPEEGQVSTVKPQTSAVALVPGPLRGLGSMGPHGTGRFCDVRAVGLSQWRPFALTQILGLDVPQQAALGDLAAASAKALAMISDICKTSAGDKSQLSVMEMRVETLLRVLKVVRPAYEAFYSKLDGNQKLRLDALGPRRNGWRW